MRTENHCRLEGTVRGETWTRWRSLRAGVTRGQVRFWLVVPRELAGDGNDVLLCAVEPRDETELRQFEAALRDDRHVAISAEARCLAAQDPELGAGAHHASVIFVAESLAFEGAAVLADLQPKHKVRPHGKAAAAGDELALEGGAL